MFLFTKLFTTENKSKPLNIFLLFPFEVTVGLYGLSIVKYNSEATVTYNFTFVHSWRMRKRFMTLSTKGNILKWSDSAKMMTGLWMMVSSLHYFSIAAKF